MAERTVAVQDQRMLDRRWTILAFLGLAQLMVVLDATIVNVALPSIQQGLGFTNGQRQWVVTAYTLAFGGLLLLGGKISDVVGRKRTLVIGLIGFATASGVGGAAQSFGMLAAARAVQGAFGALLAPSVLALLTTTFTDPLERDRAFGVYGAIVGSGASVGLLLGGVLTQELDWRWVMYVNVVIALIAVPGTVTLLVNRRADTWSGLDVPGTVAVAAGLFALVYAFSNAETTSWGNAVSIAFLLAGVALLALFVRIEGRASHPLLPLRIVRDRNRGAAFLSMAFAVMALFGVFLFLSYFFQQNEGYDPIRTGLAFLPMTLVLVVTSITASTFLRPRFGPRPLVAGGMLIAALAMLYLTRLNIGSAYASDILPALLVLGVALGLVFNTVANNATLAVPPSDAGVASATLNACQQVGGSLGTALLSTIAASATSSFLIDLRPNPAEIGLADVHGYTVAFGWSAAVFAAGAIEAALLFKGGVPEAERREQAAERVIAA